MRIYKCTSEEKPKEFTFDEISEREGVYESVECADQRFIVLTNSGHGKFVIFLGTSSLEPAYRPSWEHKKFRRLNDAKVCIEIK